jgi:hypothetical protein
VNTIFWGNLNSQIGIEDGGPPTVSYCDVQGGYTGTGNIDCDPMFCDTLNGNYELDRLSCCLGSGESGADIGAFGDGCGLPTIINVPADFPTIQAAIDISLDGDTILVQPGTYYENINFNGKNIIVASLFFTTEDTSYISSTIIDGDSSGSVVTIANGEDSTAIITGFTIQHGYNPDHGGGILLGASPKVLYNRITQNRAYFWGGGIQCSGGAPIIEYNEIIDNDAGDTFNKGGGGIHCYYSNARIENNIISENTGSLGGGIKVFYSYPVISNNIIRNNEAVIAGGGCSYYGGGTNTYNIITGNTAQRGAGIDLEESSPIIQNNTFYLNMASWKGGGLACSYTSVPPVTNNIFWADSAVSGGNEICTDFQFPGSPIVTYCDVQDSVWPGEGNISCDPEFCGPDTGNFFLAGVSCCAGSGQDGVDIGAYGVDCGPYPVPAIVSVVPSQNELNVLPGSNVSVTFDMDMDDTTINDSTFVVNARSVGMISGIITYDSLTKTAQLNPTNSFEEGEIITVTLTTGIQSLSGFPIENSFGWSFTIEVISSSGTFGSHADYYAGNGPNSVFASDLDNDGDLDLATANVISSNVSVLLNDGNGAFAFDSAYIVEWYNPTSIFSADLDRDSDMDLLAAGYDTNSVSVLMNNGAGTFSPYMGYFTGTKPKAVCAGDVNGDGFLDIITANYYFDPMNPVEDSSSVSVLLNNGNGLFGYPFEYAIGREPSSVFTSDLNNDGNLDIAVSNYADASISVMLNSGNGWFNPHTTYAVGDGPTSVFGADLDGDGDMDMAAVSVIFSHLLSILWNNGNGTFVSGPTYPVAERPRSVCAADLDGDGDQDIATSNRNADNVSIFMNNGDGTFAAQQLYSVADGPVSIASGDFDGNGDLDIVTTNYFTDNVSILLNIGLPGWLIGTVTDQWTDPIEGVIVTATGTTTEDTTDIYGVYALDSLEAGLYDISFSHPDYRDTIVTGVEVAGQDTTILDVIMEELPGLLSGTVTDGDSQPIESVYVEINTLAILAAESNENNFRHTAKSALANKSESGLLLEVVDSVYTDSNGYYECSLVAGSYDVDFSHPDFDDTTCVGIAITPGDTTILDMQMVLSGCEYVTGDVNGSDSYNGLDITYGVNFFKYGTPEPQCPYGSCPIPPCDAFFYCGDVNASCNYNGLDITYGVNYFKFGSPGPVPCGDCPPMRMMDTYLESIHVSKHARNIEPAGRPKAPEKSQK